jgi:N-acetylneuraminate synthase
MARYIAENFYPQLESILSKYPDDVIIVLGKGSSADLISQEILDKYFVIGINDSELIGAVDLTILKENWAVKSVKANGFKSEIYILPDDLIREFPEKKGIGAKVTSDARDEEEVFQQLNSNNFYLGSPLLISAGNLVQIISRNNSKHYRIFFVGFDFDTNAGYSKRILSDNSQDSMSRKKSLINSQIDVFKRMKYLLGNSKVSIMHVGNQEFSDISSSAFNLQFARATKVSQDNKTVGVEITAEITTNHLGDIGIARKMIQKAAQDGATFVKFQMRDVDSFYSPEQLRLPYRSPFGETFRDYRKALEFSNEQFREIEEICAEIGISWFASILDMPSFVRSQELGMNMIKLPSTISEKKSYLRQVSQDFSGVLVLSTGMTDSSYLEWVVSNFTKQSKVYLLHANSAYPTPNEDCNVRVIRSYEELSNDNPRFIPGYSSHDVGSLGSILAIASGARMVEKHVKWENNDWLHFDSVALNLQAGEFRDYVSAVRDAEICLGDGIKRITKSEHHKY